MGRQRNVSTGQSRLGRMNIHRLAARLVAGALAGSLATFAVPLAAHADHARESEWHLGPMHFDEARGVSRGEGVIVGIVDTAVDSSRPELTSKLMPGKGFAPSD